MANAILQEDQSSITWSSAGETEVLTLTSLASAGGRMGEEHDFGNPYSPRVRLQLEVDFNAAPTAGLTIDVYWSSSIDGADYDGECSGADAAYNSEDDMKRLHWVGSLMASNDTDPQIASWVFWLPARYGLPVISNQSGQALTNVGTDQIVTVTPLTDEVQ